MALHYLINLEVVLTSFGVYLVERTVLDQAIETLEWQFLGENAVLKAAGEMGAAHMAPALAGLALDHTLRAALLKQSIFLANYTVVLQVLLHAALVAEREVFSERVFVVFYYFQLELAS